MKEINCVIGYIIFLIGIMFGGLLGYRKRKQEEPSDIQELIDNKSNY